jgi:hypothetical protein
MDGKQLVVLEGQQHWIDPAIAQDDTLLRQLFSSLNPAYADAEIKRSTTKIEIVARKGTKGSTPLDILDAEAIAINPGIACCIALQQLELRVGIAANHAPSIAAQIEAALAHSDQWETHLKATLRRLDAATAAPMIPLGF